MIKNYFKIAWRTLLNNKLYTSLNIAGLTFGFTCFLLIGLYLFDELTFDQQHNKADRIYRLIEHKNTKGEALSIAGVNYQLAEESKKAIAEIENTTHLSRLWRANIDNPENKNKFQETLTQADNGFMEIFDFKTLDGNLKTALKEPYSIILVEDLALRLFGTTQVVGKSINFEFDQPFRVTAVLKNHPRNSSFDFTSIISESTQLRDTAYANNVNRDWSSNAFVVFALLKNKTNAETVAPKLKQLVYTHFTPQSGNSVAYSLQKLSDMHLYSENITDGLRNSNAASINQGSLLYLKIFGIVALFVLLIACINYMNLTTARAANRSKEIGVRKTIGAFRSHLVYQFLIESILIATISFVLSVIVVNLLLPSFNQFVDKKLSLGFGTDYRIWLCTLAITALIGLLSGSYPALLLSRFRPVLLLKGMKVNNKTGISLRKSLVVFQFSISIIMIIATMVLFLQARYINNKDLGFNKEQLVVVDINSGKIRTGAQTIKTEFQKIPNVKNVAITSRVPGEWKTIPMVKIKPEGNEGEHKAAYFLTVDDDFTKTFNVSLLQGRNFANPSDSSAILLNETAAKELNIKEASEQWVEIPSRSFGGSYSPINRATNQPFRAKIIGIVKDFNFQSLREKIAPMVLGYQRNPVHVIDYFTAKIESKDLTTTLSRMKAVMVGIDIDELFEYHFLDEQLALFYANDQRRQTLLIWVALATIFIAALGLFGLATYAAEQRIKEIGVRKVLGASVAHLTALLSKDFLKLVLIANGIAFPIAWWATDKWLQEFAYHVEIKWWVFALAGFMAFLIALLTVSFQAIKAAVANPVKSLRTE